MSCMCGKCDNRLGWGGHEWYNERHMQCPPQYGSPTFTNEEKLTNDIKLGMIMEKAQDDLREVRNKFLRRFGFYPCKPIEERG